MRQKKPECQWRKPQSDDINVTSVMPINSVNQEEYCKEDVTCAETEG